jgi:NhaB family Na+:H+ antiporter
MTATLAQVGRRSFLGHAPRWYKVGVGAFLVLNPLLLWLCGAPVAGWAVLLEFIFTLGMALKCYPLQPGGLLAIEAVAIGLTSAEGVSAEVVQAFPVLLLLIFGVIDLARLMQAQASVTNAARRGIRYAVTGQPSEQLGKGFIHGTGDAVHRDGPPDRGVGLRGARLDLRLMAHGEAFRQVRYP